jgi:hypothetical protein
MNLKRIQEKGKRIFLTDIRQLSWDERFFRFLYYCIFSLINLKMLYYLGKNMSFTYFYIFIVCYVSLILILIIYSPLKRKKVKNSTMN